jgi:hypothetical protein
LYRSHAFPSHGDEYEHQRDGVPKDDTSKRADSRKHGHDRRLKYGKDDRVDAPTTGACHPGIPASRRRKAVITVPGLRAVRQRTQTLRL